MWLNSTRLQKFRNLKYIGGQTTLTRNSLGVIFYESSKLVWHTTENDSFFFFFFCIFLFMSNYYSPKKLLDLFCMAILIK